jgi:two-component system, chemotaxis family, protein-glutamate methylesterase/glutaminase
VSPPAATASGPPRTDGAAAPRPIRLMIVDDSAIARAVLSRMLSARSEFEVVALAGNAAEALDALRGVAVDIVLLDVEMPGGSGLDALPEVLRLGAGARVLVVSSLCEDGAEATVRALALGAADTLPKPGTGAFAGRFSEILADKLRRIGPAPAAHAAAGQEAEDQVRLRAMPDWKLGCVAIGASTGGLHALNEFLAAMPERIGAPLLVTQHLPALFMPFFARQIEAVAGRPARVAEEGELLVPDEILVAPGDAHLKLDRNGARVRVRLCRKPAPSGCLPSVDPMLAAVAEAYGKSGLGVVLSGMGRDGAHGSRSLVEAGGAVIAQNRTTSAVWGMPRAVAEAGLASAVLPPAGLARRIAARVRANPWS